jgi:predicted RNA binding protein YcfA (HicA-like mRNA interferase family)
MSRQSMCSGRDAVRAFERLGYQLDHQTGSHINLLLTLNANHGKRIFLLILKSSVSIFR